MSEIEALRLPFPLTGPAHPVAADGTGPDRLQSTIINSMVERPPRPTGQAPAYVVVGLEQDAGAQPGHDHVVGIETRDPDGGSTRWRLIEVIGAVRSGERFVLEGDGSGADSNLEPAVCPACRRVTLRVRFDTP